MNHTPKQPQCIARVAATAQFVKEAEYKVNLDASFFLKPSTPHARQQHIWRNQ